MNVLADTEKILKEKDKGIINKMVEKENEATFKILLQQLMKKLLLFYFLSLSLCSFAQNIESLKNKTPKNAAERTLILDIIRASLYQDYKQEFIFVVNTLNVSSQFAWFQGTAVRKDGKEIRTNDYDDCCHVGRPVKEKL